MSVKKRGLGKGLNSLLSKSNQSNGTLDEGEYSESYQITQIDIKRIKPGVYQPRKYFDESLLEELSISIQQQGVIQPIVVVKKEMNYEIVAGERRWRAAQKAGLKSIPCIIKEAEERDLLALSLIENIQRENLNAIEESLALVRLKEEYSLTHQEIADIVGKNRSTVSNLIRLYKLPDEIKEMIEQGFIEMGHARALLGLEGEEQKQVAQQIKKQQLNVRDVEKLIQSNKKREEIKSYKKEDLDEQPFEHHLQQIKHILDVQIKLKNLTDNKKRISIDIDESKVEVVLDYLARIKTI